MKDGRVCLPGAAESTCERLGSAQNGARSTTLTTARGRVGRTAVVVADPLPIFASAVGAVLQRYDFAVEHATTTEELVAIVNRGDTAIALVDVDLEPHGAIAALSEIGGSPTHVVVWAFAPTPGAMVEAVEEGASGYLDKRISPSNLVRALHGLGRGEAPLPRTLATLLIAGIHQRGRRAEAETRTSSLSAREHEVLQLIAANHRNREIAAMLYLSEFTVKRHVQNILAKLNVPTRRIASDVFFAAAGSGGA